MTVASRRRRKTEAGIDGRRRSATASRRRSGAARTVLGPRAAARLMAAADRAREFAYAPYSGFAVGAALLTRQGRIITGCNVENSSFGLSVCAERNAVWKALSEGERDFVAIAVTAGRGEVASPCGSCRQVLHEFAPHIRIYWRDARGRIMGWRLERLLRQAFDLVKGRGQRSQS